MCRRKHLQGCCMMAFGFGLWMGSWLHSWFWCGLGGLAAIGLGLVILRSR